jgi:hypothetical protein
MRCPMRQNMPFGARPTDSIEGIMPVQIGGYFAGQNARRGARPAPIWPARHNR